MSKLRIHDTNPTFWPRTMFVGRNSLSALLSTLRRHGGADEVTVQQDPSKPDGFEVGLPPEDRREKAYREAMTDLQLAGVEPTQELIAEKVGRDPRTIQRWEAARRRPVRRRR